MNLSPSEIKTVERALMPYSSSRFDIIRKYNIRFSHYTSAEAAMSIIRNNNIWLRNSKVMNDFSEISYGQDMLHSAWVDNIVGGRMKRIFDILQIDAVNDIEKIFNEDQKNRSTRTYMTSISEHGNSDTNEDEIGRLSMWRAYGGSANVCLILKHAPFTTPSSALSAYTSPVLYANEAGFKIELNKVLNSIESDISLFHKIDRKIFSEMLLYALHFAVLSTKHPGFAEEREWRIIYSPHRVKSEIISEEIAIISGIPQKIYKITFQNKAESGLLNATLPELLDRVIIGPTQYPWPMYEAFVQELEAANVPDAGAKVFVSSIPLRR